MRTKLFLFLFFLPFLVYTQDIAIELSIEWQKSDIPLIYKKENTIPFLKVNFRNLSNKKIYFKNPLNNKSLYPDIINTLLHRSDKDINTLEEVYKSHSNDTIPFYVLFDKFFLVLEQSEYENFTQQKEYITTFATDELSMLYSLFKLQDYYAIHNYEKQSLLFNYKGKKTVTDPKELKEDIWKMERQQKVFTIQNRLLNNSNLITLESQESKVIEFNLLAFKIIGGKYEFCLNFNTIKDSHQLDNNDITKEDHLNLTRKGYHLYEGSFFSNSVKVDF